MSGLREVREVIVARGMDAQAANAVQARLIDNRTTPEVDSLLEVFGALARLRLSDRERLVLVARGVRLTRAVAAGNAAERAHVHELTGAAERLGRKSLTVKEAARRLRAPLADLTNPMITGERRRVAVELVVQVLAEAPAGLLHDACGRPRRGIAGELNSVAKTTALSEVIAGRVPARDRGAAA